MTKAQAKEIQLKEKQKIDVVVPEISISQKIMRILEDQGLANSAEGLHERVNAFPEPNRSTLARCFDEGKEGNSFYNAVAIEPIAGKILSIRYAQIYDTIYLIYALFNSIITESDLILDVGTCTGFTPITLSKLGMGKWTGIDQSTKCIDYAKNTAKDAGCLKNVSFTRSTLDSYSKTSKSQFKLVINSRGPLLSSKNESYKTISKLIAESGFLVYIEEYVHDQADALKIYNKSGLSLIYRDIVGGWNQTEEDWGVWSFSVFFKGHIDLPTGKYKKEYESLWHSHFRDYCNGEARHKPEQKTQCMMREFFRKPFSFENRMKS